MIMTQTRPLVPVVLSGGAGTRLWPISRETNPKPFIRLPDGETLIGKTYQRALALDNVAEVLTIANRDYYFRCRDEFLQAAESLADAAPGGYLLEPCGRNTAPAIALGALHVAHHHGEDALLLVMPSDHLIEDVAGFVACARHACALAAGDWLTTFGIVPLAPETGFGYIETGAALPETGFEAKRFCEKPNLDTARQFLAAGNYYWNSGMFCFSAGHFLRELQEAAPELFAAVAACWQENRDRRDDERKLLEFTEASFSVLPDISVDYALMEKARRVALVPADFDWSDIGSWSAIASLVPADEAGNRISGEAVLHDSKDCYLHSETRIIGALGLDDCIVVDTPDALLVAQRDRVQDVRVLVQQLKLRGHDSVTHHRTVIRPWGSYTLLEEGPRFKIKRLEIKPGASLSLQMHYHRSEHWIVVHGTAHIVNGSSEILLHSNESTYIPAGHRHRLANPGVIDLVIIEVQSGDYLGEDDIVRFEDRYGRV
jgi:mannose-1-phosphate guanylyltransferase